ncbi:matrixin family metalloprotease [Kineosporia sp. NBRC 101731]|uniref:matrixin family metalloprotease n=1 Tax=Kineosporia sp. NBRC 101731 TaxID=3032199 RepID=UPI002555EF1F|nr:matrixin family metalloprotease [Kineosporia sp. NBRC 101731]
MRTTLPSINLRSGRVRAALAVTLGALVVVPVAVNSLTPAGASTPVSAAGLKITVSGPATVTAAKAYPVTVTGDDRVCGVMEGTTNQIDRTKPYRLTFSPKNLSAGPHKLSIAAIGCSDTNSFPVYGSVTKAVTVPVHVESYSRWIAPASSTAADRKLGLKVTTAKAGVTVKLMRGSKTVTSLGSRSTKAATYSWKPAGVAKGDYTLAVTSGGSTVRMRTSITNGWAPMQAPFPRCKTLTWRYDASGEPARADGIEKDLRGAFTRVSKVTGLKFKQVKSGGTIKVDWGGSDRFPDGGNDAAGVGGSTVSGGKAVSGGLTLNTASTWVGAAGFGHDANDFPARGGLILHELGHVLGLGHVTSKKALMYPVSSNGSPSTLTAYEKAGLKALYPAC